MGLSMPYPDLMRFLRPITLLAPLALLASLVLTSPSQAAIGTRTIDWSGYTWVVKTSGSGTQGPGANIWSDSTDNVAVTADGSLRLAITNMGTDTDPKWACAEVANTRSLGYGTYRWTIKGDVTQFAPEVVLGMFTWSASNNPAYAYREIDVEYSKWAYPPATKTGLFTVQTDPTRNFNYQLTPDPTSTASFTWTRSSVVFKVTSGPQTITWTWKPAKGKKKVPVPGDEQARINLWLSEHKAPTTGTRAIEFTSFTFAPA